ncbi:MAG: hypothetical protein ACRET0_02290 [Steroidobacteraceae bacterium]
MAARNFSLLNGCKQKPSDPLLILERHDDPLVFLYRKLPVRLILIAAEAQGLHARIALPIHLGEH